jgi:hypothetical protein
MRALVIGRPKFQVPPEQAPEMVQGALEWYERYQDSFQAFGTFFGGGGFGIVDVPDAETLNRMIVEMPFTPYCEITVEPFVEGDTGFRQFQEAMQAMTGVAS